MHILNFFFKKKLSISICLTPFFFFFFSSQLTKNSTFLSKRTSMFYLWLLVVILFWGNFINYTCNLSLEKQGHYSRNSQERNQAFSGWYSVFEVFHVSQMSIYYPRKTLYDRSVHPLSALWLMVAITFFMMGQ